MYDFELVILTLLSLLQLFLSSRLVDEKDMNLFVQEVIEVVEVVLDLAG